MATLAAVLVAAGSAAASGARAKKISPTTINVGVLPIADVAPLYLGMKLGYFAKQNLKVVPHALQGGADVVSGVVGGSLQFGFGAIANVVQAQAKNLPIKLVANGDVAAAKPASAWSGILVNGNSSITSIKQLAGKTIAVNALQGENQLALDAILLKNGVSPSSVHLVALPFPTMPAALSSGQVDAVTEVQPFVSVIEGAGGKVISPLFEGMAPSMVVAGYFAPSSEITKQKGLVTRFVTAMNQSLAYARTHAGLVRAVIPTYTTIPTSVAAKLQLPVWSARFNTASILSQEKLMLKLHWITKSVPVNRLIWSGATS